MKPLVDDFATEVWADAGVEAGVQKDQSNLIGRRELRDSYCFAIGDSDDPATEMEQFFRRLLYGQNVKIEVGMMDGTAFELTVSDDWGEITYLCDIN